jgi:transcriptional regulator NrdR family protein
VTCPSCLVGETQVLDSRPAPCEGTRRRRRCQRCDHRFSTYEIHADVYKRLRDLEKRVQGFFFAHLGEAE